MNLKNNSNLGKIGSVPATNAPAPSAPGSQMKANNKSVVILRMKTTALIDKTVEELEEKYLKKFGCKVVILESNLEIVDVING